VGIVHARYDPVTPATGWRTRVHKAMGYYARRPGRDKEREEREHPGVKGRWFVTADGERLPPHEAEQRFARAAEAQLAAAQAGRAERERALTERYGRPIRLPEPTHRFYQVVVSTRDVALHDRDAAAILAQAFAGPTLYVRHENTANPHLHVVALTNARGLDVDDLNRLRAHVLEREQARERERDQGREREPARERLRQPDRGYGLGD
jgi:hypothetical protein